MSASVAKTLLSIDDDESILWMIKITLERTAGWTILTANSGHDGLIKAQANHLDAILLDGHMPGLNGIETFHRLQQKPASQGLPVVFLTATPQVIKPLIVNELGIKGIIQKPFETQLLAAQLVHILGWHSQNIVPS